MSNGKLNRHEWLKVVAQDSTITDRAKALAIALWSYSNDETGQLNPTVPTLADFVKRDVATVKRAIADLVDAGWLTKTDGRGRGNKTSYKLLWQSEIAQYRADKKLVNTEERKGAVVRFQNGEKGAVLSKKERSTAPFHIEDKQPSEQRDSVPQRYRSHRFTGNPFDGLWNVPSSDRDTLYAWGNWLKANDFPALDNFPIVQRVKKKGPTFYSLPWKKPPTEPELVNEAYEFFASMLVQEEAHAVNA